MSRTQQRLRQSAAQRRSRIVAITIAGCALLLLAGLLWLGLSVAGRRFAGGIVARVAIGDRPINVLLIANNARDAAADKPLGLGSAAGQADVIVLVHFDPAAHAIYAITIPRDTLVAQPRWHNPVPKIKTLFYMGDQETPPRGPQYLVKAVGDLTGLSVDGYLVANFASFKAAVDLVGGLTVDVKARIYDPHDAHADFQPGVQHMNGAQTLAFVRVRQNHAGNSYRTDDFQRMQAEVTVLGLLRDRLSNPAAVQTLLPRFVSRMKHDVATNLSEAQLVGLGIATAGAPVYQVPLGSTRDSMTLVHTSIPGINASGSIYTADYVVLDPDEVRKRLASFGSRSSNTGLDPLTGAKAIPVTLYGTPHMLLHFEHRGFRHVVRAGGATGANEVVYPSKHPDWGWQAARALGSGTALVEPGAVDTVIARE
jgi:LCP family protein required for cell wall assembly